MYDSKLLCEKITKLRKTSNLTQEMLADKLGITFQAVSKWETGQCCPDLASLPVIAEILSEAHGRTITLDELFDLATAPVEVVNEEKEEKEKEQKEKEQEDTAVKDNSNERIIGNDKYQRVWTNKPKHNGMVVDGLPWKDDGGLRAVVFIGSRLMTEPCKEGERFTFEYEGDALDVTAYMNINCGDIEGDASANGSITCADIGGDASANGSINCADIGGDASANGGINCADIGGDVSAGAGISCADIGGDVSAGNQLSCGEIGGDASAGSQLNCGDISGDVSSGGGIQCGNIEGDVNCEGDIECDTINGDVRLKGSMKGR